MRASGIFKERGWQRIVVAAAVGVIGLMVESRVAAQEKAPLTEYQIKALCVLNFAKYVDWPGSAFAKSDAPITIGVLGNSEVAEVLEAAAKGKTISGRAVVIEPITAAESIGQFQILFVGAAENGQLAEISSQVKGHPILTVGESSPFEKSGGMINFVLKNNKVRFDINLTTASEAGIRISSKLLTLADSVQGNPK